MALTTKINTTKPKQTTPPVPPKPVQRAQTEVVTKKKKLVELGALWARESEKDQSEFFTGNITVNGVREELLVLRNNYKEHDKMPDWRIYQREMRNPTVPAARPQTRPNPDAQDDFVPQDSQTVEETL